MTRDLIAAQKDDFLCTNIFLLLFLQKWCKRENGVLMCRWCPDTSEAEWYGASQIVIPAFYRQTYLSLAHDHDFSGHLGIKKSYHRILKHFFWPCLRPM